MTAWLAYLSMHMSAGLAFLSALAVVTSLVRIVRMPPTVASEEHRAGFTRRLALLFIAIYLLGATVREYGVLTYGMTAWGHQALEIALVSRACQVIGAVGFIGASSHAECGHRLWICAAAVALAFSFLF